MGWVRGAGAARSACLGVAGSLCVSAGQYWGGLSRGTAVFVVHSRGQAGTGILGKALFKHCEKGRCPGVFLLPSLCSEDLPHGLCALPQGVRGDHGCSSGRHRPAGVREGGAEAAPEQPVQENHRGPARGSCLRGCLHRVRHCWRCVTTESFPAAVGWGQRGRRQRGRSRAGECPLNWEQRSSAAQPVLGEPRPWWGTGWGEGRRCLGSRGDEWSMQAACSPWQCPATPCGGSFVELAGPILPAGCSRGDAGLCASLLAGPPCCTQRLPPCCSSPGHGWALLSTWLGE